MKNKYLGVVCIIYSIMIFYLLFSDLLKNFIAPNMQKYTIMAGVLFLIIGGVFLFNSKYYNFKIIDLIYLLPIVLLIISGDGRLSTNLVKNRTNNYMQVSQNNKKQTPVKELEEITEEYNLDTIDFDITDETYTALTNYLTYEKKAEKYIGKTIRIRGFVLEENDYVPKGYIGLGKYEISCCAADAAFTGIIAYTKEKVEANSWYEVIGVLEKSKDAYNNDILAVNIIKISKLTEKEEQYVYPCYSYGDGNCTGLTKYDLEY